MRFFLLLLILTPSLAYACMWINGTSINGGTVKHISGRSASMQFVREMKRTPQEKFNELKNEYKGTDDFSNAELKAVELTFSGAYSQAIPAFLIIEEKYPGRYSTAANLGTTYELNGEPELALKWITEGIKRNPKSHDGTEWLHQIILETKLKIKENPNFLMQNRIIELPKKITQNTKINISGTSYTVEEIQKAIIHQLKERLVFVKPKEPIVADLLFTLGIIDAHTEILESSIKILTFSQQYGFTDSILIDQTINDYNQIIKITFYWHVSFEIILVILTLVLIFKQKTILNQIRIKTGKPVSESLYKFFVGGLLLYTLYFYLSSHTAFPF